MIKKSEESILNENSSKDVVMINLEDTEDSRDKWSLTRGKEGCSREEEEKASEEGEEMS